MGLAFLTYRTAKDFGRHGWIIFGASFWYLRGYCGAYWAL
jgi:hypothetical protein